MTEPGLVIKSVILSLMMGLSCQMFYETVVPRRRLRYGWLDHTTVLAFAAGFMVIAVTKIPPYFLQPVRVVVVTVIVSQIYFQMQFVKNLLLSVIFCGIYWIVSILFFSVISVMPVTAYADAVDMLEPLLDLGYLGAMFAFRCHFQKRFCGMDGIKWERFGLLALVGIVVSVAGIMMPTKDDVGDYYVRLVMVVGFAVVYIFGFYYMISAFEKEEQMKELRLFREQTRNQMKLYQSRKERYEQQMRLQHDYKNQLGCIQGLVGSGQIQEALSYIAGLTGKMSQNDRIVSTNHSVVNVILNQKYRQAYEKGIAMTIVANDLSGLAVSEEDLVILLGNLLDNAIEACEKLQENKIIRFKMVLEEGQLVLSVHNPVREPVRIRGSRIVTGKRDRSRHGIGLLNVDAVIRKNEGTSVLKCEEGWFSFAAIIPQ